MSENFPRELWDNPAFHKGREWGRMERDAEIVHKVIKYLKTTPAVTLVGKGGAYELLEEYAQKLEEEA